MKNTLRVDFNNKTIIMDRTFAKNCENTESREYAHLQTVRKDYPDFCVTLRKIKRNPNKETYKGLSYAFMQEYILHHGSEAEIAKNLNDYRELRWIAKCHQNGHGYANIKSWFLETYPEITEFSIAA